MLLLAFWQPWGGRVWHLEGAVAVVVWSLCAAGWLLAIASTFAVDHLELTGLRSAEPASPQPAGAYRVVPDQRKSETRKSSICLRSGFGTILGSSRGVRDS